jgi:hypothetical protein
MASEMLEKNISNRPLVKATIKKYSQDIINNNWRATSPVCFNCLGELLDGQHRLNAIIMARKNVDMVVIKYNENIKTINSPFDIGKSRSISDITGESKELIAVLSFIYRFHSGRNYSPSTIQQFRENLGIKCEWFKNSMSNTSARVFSSAPIRSACFIAYLNGYDWSDQYNKLVCSDIENMDKKTIELYKKLNKFVGLTGTEDFRRTAYLCSVIVATENMGKYKIFSSELLEFGRRIASDTIKKYLPL